MAAKLAFIYGYMLAHRQLNTDIVDKD